MTFTLSRIDRKHSFNVRNTFTFGFRHEEHSVQETQQTEASIKPEGSLWSEHLSERRKGFPHNKGENQINHGHNTASLTTGTRWKQFSHQDPWQGTPSDLSLIHI